MILKKLEVSRQESGYKLLAYLKEKYAKQLSVKAIKRAVDSGKCSVNGAIERFSTRLVKQGDIITIHLQEQKVQKMSPSILYEDEDLLICDKPPGVISDNTIFNSRFPQYANKLELVHRLDKDTSGILILAKTPRMRRVMEELFVKRAVRKLYLAIVDKPMQPQEGKIETLLIKKSSQGGQATWGSVKSGRGKRAITLWRVVQIREKVSLLALEPLTGRTHQLRVHLSEWGHPILGDIQYAKKFLCSFRPQRQLLHAYKIIFWHHLKEKEIELVAPIPQDFLESLNALHLDLPSISF